MAANATDRPWNGFLGRDDYSDPLATGAGIDCKQCGAELSGPNGPRPAESYAGTFTGLCYRCSNGAAYVAREHDDGCQEWSYPPHCPSWRRDRETFYGFADCHLCHGAGRKVEYRPLSSGGSFPRQCHVCSARHFQTYAPQAFAETLSPADRETFLYALNVGRLPVTRYTDGPAAEQWNYTGKGKRKDPGLTARVAGLAAT